LEGQAALIVGRHQNDGVVVGRIMKAAAAPVDAPWLWTLAFGHHEDRTPTHGNARGRDGGVREELAAGVKDRPAGGLIQNDSGLPQGPAGRFRAS
jgi:hypothetical protein